MKIPHIFVLSIAIFVAACGGSDDGTNTNDGAKNSIGEVSGIVSDATSGNILSNVTISVGGQNILSSDVGEYNIKNISVGSYTLTARVDNYLIYSSLIGIAENQNLTQNITLKINSISLPTNNLLAYWAMDNSQIDGVKLREKFGGTSGSMVGDIVTATGKVGEALALDGVNDYVDFGDVFDATFSGNGKQFTISMWFKSSSIDNYTFFAKAGDTSCSSNTDQRQFYLGLDNGEFVRFGYSVLNGTSGLVGESSNISITLDQWHHLAVIYDGSTTTSSSDRVEIYLDGQQSIITNTITLGNFPFDIMDGSAHLSLGMLLDSNGDPCTVKNNIYFSGMFDELAIWNKALTSVEVGSLRQRGLDGVALIE